MRQTKAQLLRANEELQRNYDSLRAFNDSLRRYSAEQDVTLADVRRTAANMATQLAAKALAVSHAQAEAQHELNNACKMAGDLHQCEKALEDRAREALAASQTADRNEGRATAYRELLSALVPGLRLPATDGPAPWRPDECRAAAVEQLQAMKAKL